MKIIHQEEYNPSKIRVVNLITFLLGVSSGLTFFIVSSYFKQVSGSDNVSWFFMFVYFGLFLVFVNFHKLIRVFGKSFVFIASIFLLLATTVLLAVLNPSWASAVVLIINIMLFEICYAGKDIVLESFSTDKRSGTIRGLHLAIFSIGGILTPYLSTLILGRFNFQGVYFFQIIINVMIFMIAFTQLRKVNHCFKSEITIKGIIEKILKRKTIARIYHVSLATEFFYFIFNIYVPIHLLNLGMSWSEVGIVFTFLMLPWVILPYPAGIISDRYGEKKMILFSIFILGVSSLSIFFIDSGSLFVWILVALATRVSVSVLGTAYESFFYKQIDGRDVDLINYYKTAKPIGQIMGAGLTALFLLIFSLKFVFILMGVGVLSSLFSAYKMDK